jgi:glycosyltransferase involved in cell wall biosynthesis
MSATAAARLATPMVDAAVTVSVVVATFRRLERLNACLDGLQAQSFSAAEVLVVTHGDPETDRYVEARAENWSALKLVLASHGHSVAAYNAGLRAA